MVAGIDRGHMWTLPPIEPVRASFKLIDEVGDIVFRMPGDNGKFSASGLPSIYRPIQQFEQAAPAGRGIPSIRRGFPVFALQTAERVGSINGSTPGD